MPKDEKITTKKKKKPALKKTNLEKVRQKIQKIFY